MRNCPGWIGRRITTVKKDVLCERESERESKRESERENMKERI